MPEPEEAAGRVLGLDLGDVRIGVAITDDQRRLAVPYGTIHTGAPADFKAVAALVEELDVTAVVLGHPLAMSGEAGTRAQKAEAFAQALRAVLGDQVPIMLQDERLSTVEATRALRASGTKGKKARKVVDRSAATVILQAFCDRS